MSIRLDALQSACQGFERALALTKTIAEAEAEQAQSCRQLEACRVGARGRPRTTRRTLRPAIGSD